MVSAFGSYRFTLNISAVYQYDFHKTVQDPSHGEFAHPYFKQNRPDLLGYIKRKANNRNSDQNKKVAASRAPQVSSNNTGITDLPMHDLDALDSLDMYNEGDLVVGDEKSSDFERKMEAKLSKVEEENRMLKRMFMESHQKNLVMQDRMEKVLKTLYSVFMGQQGGGGKALPPGRIPVSPLCHHHYCTFA